MFRCKLQAGLAQFLHLPVDFQIQRHFRLRDFSILGDLRQLLSPVLPAERQAEKMDLLQEKMVPAETLEAAEEHLDLLEATVRRRAKAIAQLKQAQ